MDILEIENKIVIELLYLKQIKLINNLFYLFLSCQYHSNKQDYDCYEMKYHAEYHFNYALTLHTKWNFDGISVMNALMETQTAIELSSLKWIQMKVLF